MAKRAATPDSDGGDTKPDVDELESPKHAREIEASPEVEEKKVEKKKEPAKKKAKKEESAEPSTSKSNKNTVYSVEKDKAKNQFVRLGEGSKRRVGVSTYKKKVHIDIREYYTKDGDELPGKKGISLTPEEWEVIKAAMGFIDGQVSNLTT